MDTENNVISFIEIELEWLSKIIDHRIEEVDTDPLNLYPLPALPGNNCFIEYIEKYNYSIVERLVISLCIACAFNSDVIKPFITHCDEINKRLKYGGVIKDRSFQFTPTVRTILFLLAGNDIDIQAAYLGRFSLKHRLFSDGVLIASNPFNNSSFLNYELSINDQYLNFFLNGLQPRLDSGDGFPASLSNTIMSYDDIVLGEKTKKELAEVEKYIRNRRRLISMKGVSSKIRHSYVIVFTGEPGTGKTITAKTIGDKYSMPVYVVSLARIVSKYIGETEKNLEKVFDRFYNQDCILFFDEADALFGKRTEVKDSKDRYANQEVAFLLQKIEEFDGIVILATNVADVQQVFDKAFQRRIRKTIRFEFPEHAERKQLWEKSLPLSFEFASGVIEELSEKYQLTGASINNIISDTLIDAVDCETDVITFVLLEPSLKAEYKKTGRRYEICRDEEAIHNPQKRFGDNLYRSGNF